MSGRSAGCFRLFRVRCSGLRWSETTAFSSLTGPGSRRLRRRRGHLHALTGPKLATLHSSARSQFSALPRAAPAAASSWLRRGSRSPAAVKRNPASSLGTALHALAHFFLQEAADPRSILQPSPNLVFAFTTRLAHYLPQAPKASLNHPKPIANPMRLDELGGWLLVDRAKPGLRGSFFRKCLALALAAFWRNCFFVGSQKGQLGGETPSPWPLLVQWALRRIGSFT